MSNNDGWYINLFWKSNYFLFCLLYFLFHNLIHPQSRVSKFRGFYRHMEFKQRYMYVKTWRKTKVFITLAVRAALRWHFGIHQWNKQKVLNWNDDPLNWGEMKLAKVRALAPKGDRQKKYRMRKRGEKSSSEVCQLPSENSQVLVGLWMLITLNCDSALTAFPHSVHWPSSFPTIDMCLVKC